MSRETSDRVNVHFLREKQTRGLGYAILCTKIFVGNEAFAVLLEMMLYTMIKNYI